MSGIEILPLTAERWADLTALFGKKGAYGGCWCMWFRQTGPEFRSGQREANREAFRAIVERGETPGLLAYVEGVPAGWVSVAPRSEFPRLQRSRNLKPVDERPAWGIVCFYIGAKHRGGGLGGALLRAAVDYARSQGAGIVEGYPIDTDGGKRISVDAAYHGILAWFRAAGFREVERRAAGRPIVRYLVHEDAAPS